MTPSFSSILQQHTAAYPLMAPQDYGKLAYQNEFGPGHMISDKQAAFDFLLREWREAARPSSPDEGAVSGAHPAPPLTAEPIGNGLCRFHLDGSFCPEEAAPLLTELFCRTALEHTGTREGLEQKLALLTPRRCEFLFSAVIVTVSLSASSTVMDSVFPLTEKRMPEALAEIT